MFFWWTVDIQVLFPFEIHMGDMVILMHDLKLSSLVLHSTRFSNYGSRSWASRNWSSLGKDRHYLSFFGIWSKDARLQLFLMLTTLLFVSLFFCHHVPSQKMLCLEPSRQITARTALEHKYFKDIGFVPWHVY